MKRLLALLALLCLLTGCGAPGEYVPTGGGLFDGVDSPPETMPDTIPEIALVCNTNESFHPYAATDRNNRSLLSLIYQGLFAVDEGYNVYPILCKSYQVSSDMRTYTFYLENATFSDGQALTAQDVVSSLRAAQKEGFYAGRFSHVSSISKVDSSSLIIKLDTPVENLPLLLDIPIIKASEISAAAPLGTGPYILERGSNGNYLRRQAAWWCSSVNLPLYDSMITLYSEESTGQIWDLFKLSDLSMVCTDSFVDFRGDYELWESENGLFLYLSCNTKSKVFSNKSIRSALTHAIDRDALTQKFFRGFAHSATLPASPAFPHYSTTLASQFGYEPEKFAQAVAEAQLADNNIVLLVNSKDLVRVSIARDIAKMLTAGGLTVTIPEVSGVDYENRLKWGEFDLCLGQTKLSPNMDLSAFFDEEGSLNYGGLSNVAANTLSLEALANSGNYQSLHKLVMEDGRLCPILFQSYAVYGKRDHFSGLSPARDNIFFYSLGKTMEDALLRE